MTHKFNFTPEQLETVDNMITYYQVHGVEGIMNYNKHFVIEDFEKLLTILETVTQQEAW